MKKLQTFLAVAALAPMLAACAPSSEDVCKHVMEIMKKEMGDAAKAGTEEDAAAGLKKCVEGFEKEKEALGAAEHKKQAKCVMAASTFADMAKCKTKEKKAE